MPKKHFEVKRSQGQMILLVAKEGLHQALLLFQSHSENLESRQMEIVLAGFQSHVGEKARVISKGPFRSLTCRQASEKEAHSGHNLKTQKSFPNHFVPKKELKNHFVKLEVHHLHLADLVVFQNQKVILKDLIRNAKRVHRIPGRSDHDFPNLFVRKEEMKNPFVDMVAHHLHLVSKVSEKQKEILKDR